ncbi:MAG: hypothetical protein AAFY41_19400 [Bacteroidota bacterium]
MKKILLILSVCTLTFLSGKVFGQNTFSGYRYLELGKDTVFYADFVEVSSVDGSIPSTNINIVTSPRPARQGRDLPVDSLFANSTYKHIFAFADLITIDDQRVSGDTYNSSRLGSDLAIGTGKYIAEPVQNFQASSKSFAGKVELSWSPVNNAQGYAIFLYR